MKTIGEANTKYLEGTSNSPVKLRVENKSPISSPNQSGLRNQSSVRDVNVTNMGRLNETSQLTSLTGMNRQNSNVFES
jgi:hypothetical protein